MVLDEDEYLQLQEEEVVLEGVHAEDEADEGEANAAAQGMAPAPEMGEDLLDID